MSLVRQNMIVLPEHRSLHTVYVGFVLLNLNCFSISLINVLYLWPLNCMYNKYNKYRLTTYDYPFSILNLLYYLSTHNFSFICMFCKSLFVSLFFFFWSLYCLFFFDIRILIPLCGILKLFFDYLSSTSE